MSKTLYKSDLIKALKDLPSDAPIWIGADSGEGYSVALVGEVFVCNATDAPLDGDDCSDWEIEYIEKGENIPKRKLKDDFVKIVEDDGTTRVSGPIIVIGRRGAYNEVDSYKFKRENEKELKKDMLIKARLELENKIKQIEREMALNDER